MAVPNPVLIMDIFFIQVRKEDVTIYHPVGIKNTSIEAIVVDVTKIFEL